MYLSVTDITFLFHYHSITFVFLMLLLRDDMV